MSNSEGVYFEPETLRLLRDVLDAAWASLAPEQRAHTSRSDMAARMLKAAAVGERDPQRLRAQAIRGVAGDGMRDAG